MTHDGILYGRLKLWQPDEGPRVNMDTVLLAAWVRTEARRDSSFIELGAATGAISLMLALRFPEKFRILGLEIQPELETLAQRNLVENDAELNFAERVSFRRMDLREHHGLAAGSFDGVVVNPPYEEEGRGRRSLVEAVSIARQSTCCTLRDVAEASSWLLRGRGRFFAVLRTDRMDEFLTLMREERLIPKRLRLVHPRAGRRANLFLVEGMKDGGSGLVVEPPLFVYREDGSYTSELLMAYEPEGLPCL